MYDFQKSLNNPKENDLLNLQHSKIGKKRVKQCIIKVEDCMYKNGKVHLKIISFSHKSSKIKENKIE